MISDVKPWGRWATFGLGLTAMLVGQITALTAVMWWYGLGLAQLPNLASDGVFVILIVCISTPVQVLLLALMPRLASCPAGRQRAENATFGSCGPNGGVVAD